MVGRVCEDRETHEEAMAGETATRHELAGQLEAAKRLGISLNRLNENCPREAWHCGGYSASAGAITENVSTALDAAAGHWDLHEAMLRQARAS